MSAIGPVLPPHLLAKRKRKNEEEVENERTTSSGAKRSPSPSEGEKRRRVMGPVMPPASLDERPTEPPGQTSDSDSDDDDGFGPSLPPTGTEPGNDDSGRDNQNSSAQSDPATSESKPKRDDWMMMPPKQDDLAARMDPTKQRPRAFNTGKGARAPNPAGEDSSTWNETPEQKQKRLADEMMGISKPSSVGPQRPTKPTNAERDEAAAKHIKEHTEKVRGPSLLQQHTKSKGAQAEDDPSKRAFDREKDMGSGMRIGNVQRQQMLNKASDYSSKFSGGSYL